MDFYTVRHRWKPQALVAAFASLGAVGCTALVDTSTQACAAHDECQKRFGRSVFCRHDGVCATLFTKECTSLYYAGADSDAGVTIDAGVLPDPNAVILGFMGPGTGDTDKAYAQPLLDAAKAAIRSMGNVYPTGDKQRQPLALLNCNDSAEYTGVFRHLAESVRVPAIIGPVFSSTTRKLLKEVDIDRVGDTLLLSPSATAISLSTDPSPRLWRTVPPDTYQVDALIGLYQRLFPNRASNTGNAPPKLVVVTCQETGWCSSFEDDLINKLTNAGLAFEHTFYDRNSIDPMMWPKILSFVKGKDPDVVIGAGIGEIGTILIPQLEDAGFAPFYLLPEAERGDELKKAIRGNHLLATRVLGTAPGARAQPRCGAGAGSFLTKVTDGNLGEFAYDAAFMLAYAVTLAHREHPGGLELANILSQMSCKNTDSTQSTQLSPDPDGYPRFVTWLATSPSKCFDYCGVSGPLDFPRGPLSVGTNREAASDIGFWCPVVQDNGSVRYGAPDSENGMDKPYYDATSGAPPALKFPELLRFCQPITKRGGSQGSSNLGVDASVPAPTNVVDGG